MRRALATVTIAGAQTLVPVTAVQAQAEDTVASAAVLATSETDSEPLDEDGDDDTGKYGLIGLAVLFGLFGYKKYREHQASRTTTGATGRTGPDTTPGGGTSRRV